MVVGSQKPVSGSFVHRVKSFATAPPVVGMWQVWHAMRAVCAS